MANKTPTSGDFYMFLPIGGGAEDNSLESAIRMTITSGLRPSRIQNFVSLLSSIPNLDLIHNSYGTKGSMPANMGQLRGYPKPTVTLNYEVVTVGTYPALRYQKLLVKPVLNNIVGFDVVVSLDVVESDPTDGIDQHIETFTFAKGSTTPTSSTLTPDGAGKYRLDTTYPQPTNIENLGMSVDYSASVDTYLTEATTYNTSLTYIGATSVYSHDLFNYSQSTCGASVGSGITLYSTHSTLVVGSQLFTSSALTTQASTGAYARDVIPFVFFDILNYSSNQIQSIVPNCSH